MLGAKRNPLRRRNNSDGKQLNREPGERRKMEIKVEKIGKHIFRIVYTNVAVIVCIYYKNDRDNRWCSTIEMAQF